MAAAAATPADENSLFSSQIVMSLRDAPTDENPQFTQQSPMAAAAATPADENSLFSSQDKDLTDGYETDAGAMAECRSRHRGSP